MRNPDKWSHKPNSQQSNRVHRPPTRTMAELAKEFGVTSQSLSKQYVDTKVPKPAPFESNGVKTYYPYTQMKEWWKQHQASKIKEPAP